MIFLQIILHSAVHIYDFHMFIILKLLGQDQEQVEDTIQFRTSAVNNTKNGITGGPFNIVFSCFGGFGMMSFARIIAHLLLCFYRN